MFTAYLGLGSNLGDRLEHLHYARHQLRTSAGIMSIKSSSLYETEPVGGPTGQDAYLNAVLEVQTLLKAEQLLGLCLVIEASAGRKRVVHHGPRSLDIDLLLYADACCNTRRLTLPHPRLHQRRFVLQPLCDLAAGNLHPRLNASMAQLLDDLSEDGVTLLQKDW